MNTSDGIPSDSDTSTTGEYVVVARRYRPMLFEQLIGQGQVAQALQNAINTNRVGHAYLFTGPRGVGKTSAARILAKALVCTEGPTPTPCNHCDICQGVAAGGDIDVLEIDGASNRGIDEIRQLRSNVNVRPSRARFKIYIIDEVHMLTTAAFNALLKTLEEPPDHVKFIFCTTDPEKIPITVLSRCQRFDFAGIRPDAIAERLQQIADSEGVVIESAALQLLARRAAGSMRDSQSLLEQLLAFGSTEISADDVHQMLGTAGAARLFNLVDCLVRKDAGGALGELDVAIQEGVDAGPLLDQLLGYFRDMMTISIGCQLDLLLHCSAAESDQLTEATQKLGLESILAAIQILDQTAVRMRQSTHGRILLEMAVVRISKLEDLHGLSEIIAELRGDTSSAPSAAGKKKIVNRTCSAVSSRSDTGSSPNNSLTRSPKTTTNDAQFVAEPTVSAVQPEIKTAQESPPSTVAATEPPRPNLDPDDALAIWKGAVSRLNGLIVEQALKAETVAISDANSAPKSLVVGFPQRYNSCKIFCESADRRSDLERALLEETGQRLRLQFSTLEGVAVSKPVAAPVVSRRQQMRELASHPTVRRAIELFDAELVRVDQPRDV